LANKSLLFLTDVKNSTSTRQSTRAWTGVRNAQSQILHHSHAYQRAWEALRRVGTEEDLEVYQRLDQKDLVVIKDITEAKRFGQGSDRLAWFWRIGPREDALTGKWMEECKSNGLTILYLYYLFSLTYFNLVYRVNWLKAKARVDRWQEEQILVKHEMDWTIRWFQYQANLWKKRSEMEDRMLPKGHEAYAIKQQKLWDVFQKKASERFGLYL
jgi:hypothetical protein